MTDTALVAVALMCLANLCLTLGVIRRMNAFSGAGSSVAGTPAGLAGLLPPAGLRPDAGRHRIPQLAGAALVGFFTPACEPCKELLPQFAQWAYRLPIPAIAVVVGEPVPAAEVAESLAGHARVIVEPPDGPVAGAFGVRNFPAVCLLDDTGAIAFAGFDFVGFPVAEHR
ncbi:MAG: hypothetical protein JWO67_1170 [Streptosporangiaceae bacterium]|jgi:thiol-disulfide isomerase/thioredoxin|nr:hypothetical protein [Streptosporangiaceae bacterium]